MPQSNPAAYSIEGLHVELSGSPVLKGLDFSIPAGSWIGLIGPNGSGKTTLLRTLGGLLPYSGRLQLLGSEIRSLKDRERAKLVAFVRQQPTLDFDFTVRDVVTLGLAAQLKWFEQPNNKQASFVDQILEETDLTSLSERLVSTLSGGEQQRVQLAQAFTQNTPVLLLDEPTSHLDVHHQYDLMERVRTGQGGEKTVVAAFHDLAFAARYADQLVVLNDGKIVGMGPPGEILTSELIRSVFRMEAEVTSENDRISIHYLAPT